MKVYVVSIIDYYNKYQSIAGVFTTAEKAKSFLKEGKMKVGEVTSYGDFEYGWIEEHKVDSRLDDLFVKPEDGVICETDESSLGGWDQVKIPEILVGEEDD